MLNRVFLYLLRKKGKTVTLFTLIFTISTFIISSVTLLHTTNVVSRFMRESIESTISIRNHGQIQIEDETDELIQLTRTQINEILEISGIESYNAFSTGIATSADIVFRRGLASGETDNMGRLLGNYHTSRLADFITGRLELIEGRHITSDDKFVILISDTLATENELNLGDVVTLEKTDIYLNEEGLVENLIFEGAPRIEVEIIGIFTTDDFGLTIAQPSLGFSSNQMFVDNALITALNIKESGFYEGVTLYITDPSELPRIVSEIRQLETLSWDDFFMHHNDGNYTRIASDIATVQNLLTILFVAITGISIGILTLMLVLRMKERVHEVGILLSVGISKYQIISGFMLEITIVSTLAFICASVVTILIIPTLNAFLLTDLITTNGLTYDQFTNISFFIVAGVYISVLFVILITALFSTLMTLRIKPKQILAKMS